MPNSFTGGFSGNNDFHYWQSATPTFEVPLVGKDTGASPITFSTLLALPGLLLIHPGIDSDVIVRWTAPTAGIYHYSGLYNLLDINPSGVIGEIFSGNSLLPFYSGALTDPGANQSTFTAGQSESFSGTISLAAGDTLSFVVNNAGSVFNDSAGFDATITAVRAVPEPAAWGLFLLGLGAIGWAFGKRRKPVA
jgi:PEP-CTERM motif